MSQITNVRIRHVFGTIETEGEFWEDRLVMPLDVYDEFRVSKRRTNVVTEQGQPNRMDHDAYFIQIETDDGAIGIGGPVEETVAYLVDKQLTPLLLNRDPMATEFLWDIMHRSQVHGRHGQAMMAISVVDCALWDLKGRALNVPVYTLLGGPTRGQSPRLRLDARLQRNRHGAGPRTCRMGKVPRLHRAEMVLPTRSDVWTRRFRG